MEFKNLNFYTIALIITLFDPSLLWCQQNNYDEVPNVLWLVSEDNSPLLGCYGNDFATTPNLDQLASEGFLYSHAYANAPVCAPARNTIITGVYASSNGNEHMRSNYPLSDEIRAFPEYLQKAGYYCTNNSKTDYNTSSIDVKEIWNENSSRAHYKNRDPGQPFFAIFNSSITHEGSIHDSLPDEQLRHNPDAVSIPPYHPSTEAIKHDWAQYYDKVEDMDKWVGEKLQELEDLGLADNTIVFYYGDHGGVLPRSKRFVYETGTRVPFIIRIPEKYKHFFPARSSGSTVNRLISFVDLAPTLLSIAGIKIPDFMQGDAFLGSQKTDDPEYVHMFRGRMDERYDMSRAVRDRKYRYIRNYMPHRIYGQHLEYLWRAPSMQSWEETCLNGDCDSIQNAFWNSKPPEELYDTENDPWEVNNLANDPAYSEVLDRMRIANLDKLLKIKDAGFIPEADRNSRIGDKSGYDYMRSDKVNLESLIEAAEISSMGDPSHLKKMIDFLKEDDSAIRYWGVTGILILGDRVVLANEELISLLDDTSADVVATAAEALFNVGEVELAKKALLNILANSEEFGRCHALNVIDIVEDESSEIIEGVAEMVKKQPEMNRRKYDLRAAKWLLEKWEVDLAEYGIQFGW